MHKILIIDDDEGLLELCSSLLRDNGFDTVEAKDGLEGISKLEENLDISLILTDMKMPTISGLFMMKAIGLLGAYGHIPVVIYSGYGDRKTIQEATSLGVKNWLVKPTSNEDLIKAINDTLKA